MREYSRKAVADDLIREMEEEDVGISLFTTFYQNEKELCFFSPQDRIRILEILKQLSEESRQHKEILEKLVAYMEGSGHEE